MKKVISTLLAVIFLLSGMSMMCLAEETTEELTNIAPNGLAYCSSMKNSNWTPPSSIIDEAEGDWHGWEPKYPTITPMQNTSEGFSGEYCGIKFINNEYYEIYEINMTIGLHAQYRQNATYSIQALVEGVWQDVVVFKDEQFKPRSYESYEDAMENDTTNYHIGADLYYELEAPVTTNNIRITVSDYGKNYPGGDVLIFPYIYEVQLIGKRGITPDISLPEGAEFTQNASHNSFPYATSSASLAYPFLAVDGNETTAWQPSSLEAGQTLTLELEKTYKVDKFVLNFGALRLGQKAVNYKFKIEALVDGAWQELAQGNSYDEASQSYITEYQLSVPVTTAQVRLVFEEALTSAPSVYEFETHIVEERTYFLSTRFSQLQKRSSAKGNLAIFGTAYASANLAPYSDPSYINDGLAFDNSNVWFGGTLEIPVSCGVKLRDTYTVNKIVVYCAEPSVIGEDVTHFNIIAKVNGEDKIIASGKAYEADKVVENSETRYTTVYDFPEGVVTDDVRIEFTRGDSTIPNVLELEIYSDTKVLSAFDGYPSNESIPTYTMLGGADQAGGSDDNGIVPIVVGVSLCFVAAGIAVASIFIFKKNKPVEKTNSKKSENNEDSEN